MEENKQEDKACSSLISRYRSPSFRKAEVNLLVQLIEKYKNVLINKSTNSNANHAKERVWDKVAKEFNKHGLGYERSADVLRTKWDNMKKTAKKFNKDDDFNDGIIKSVAMICCDNGQSFYEEPKHVDDYVHEKDIKPWISFDDDNVSVNSTNDVEMQSRTPNKSDTPLAFSPKDCQLLLKCVRQEKNVLFSKTSFRTKHKAWRRIAEVYNKESPQKRNVKELNRKFNCMKNMAKKVNVKGYFKDIKKKKYEPLDKDIKQKIKSEPVIDCTDYDFDSDDDVVLRSPVNLHPTTNTSRLGFNHDPLGNVQGSDSGLGSIPDNKDCTRLKAELLQYKMETARLERKRIEEKIKADEKERVMKALEHSLRLRAARLDILAAESKIPPTHPNLRYTRDEREAQEYLCNTDLEFG